MYMQQIDTPTDLQRRRLFDARQAVIAYGGLLLGLAMTSLLIPLAPQIAVRPMLGIIATAAGVTGLCVQAMFPAAPAPWSRLAWAAISLVGGISILVAGDTNPVLFQLLLGLSIQAAGAAVVAFAYEHRWIREVALTALFIGGVVTFAAGLFLMCITPAPVNWLLGALQSVSLICYAGGLMFAGAEPATMEAAE